MVKFFLGVLCGALLMAIYASENPSQTKAALRSGSDTITSAIASGATSAGKLADQQLGAPEAVQVKG